MFLPAWCRAEHGGVTQHMEEEEEVWGTQSAREAGGVCRGGWVCAGAVLCLCAHREGVCAHTCVHWSKAMQAVWESTCGSVWRDTVCVPGGCVAEHSPCAGLAGQWQCWPLPWHLLHAGTAGLRQLGHAEGVWGLPCLSK